MILVVFSLAIKQLYKCCRVDYLFLYCRYKDTLVEYICKVEAERIENGKKCSLNQINQLVRYRDGGTLFQLGG